MTQVFSEDGHLTPATLIEAGPVVIVQLKTPEKDGYKSVQIGYGFKNSKHIKKPQKGHLKKISNFSAFAPPPKATEGYSKASADRQFSISNVKWLKEFRVEKPEDFQPGDVIGAGVFKEGDKVRVSAISKGKGFQGVVRRHGFAGGPRTHGQKHSEREAGSIGGGGRSGGRVTKGMRMPGRMGGRRVTMRNLKILKVDSENNLILVSGAVPGRRGTLVEIRN